MGLFSAMLLAGLVGSSTHCTVMCSPFVFSQVEGVDSQGSFLQKIGGALLVPYHLGRITTYIGMAMILNGLLNVAFVYSDLRAMINVPFLMLAGLMFLISAFPFVFAPIFPWAARLQVLLPFAWVQRVVSFASKRSQIGFLRRYLMGIALGFMPCGLVLSALLASLTAQTVIEAGVAMAAFGFGTVPVMIFVAYGGRSLMQRFPAVSRLLPRLAMVVSSVWLFVLAGTILVKQG